MADTQIDLGSVELEPGVFQDDVITFAGADTFVAGTILARDSVSGELVLFVKGGSTNENGIPKAVLVSDVSSSEAASVPARVLVRGKVAKERLVIDADGDASNVDEVVSDQLRDFGITVKSVKQLSKV